MALVIRNGTYAMIGRLRNPENDATDMPAALRRLGFEVTTTLNVDREGLTEALRKFTRRSAGANVALIFYAGHGLEMDGQGRNSPYTTALLAHLEHPLEHLSLFRRVRAQALASTEGGRN